MNSSSHRFHRGKQSYLTYILLSLIPAHGCLLMLDSTEAVEDRENVSLSIPSGSAELVPELFTVSASPETVEEGVDMSVTVRSPFETAENVCEDLGLGEYVIDVEVRHLASDQTWTRSFTPDDCRPYTTYIRDCECDFSNGEELFEVSIRSEGLTSVWNGELQFRAVSYFDHGAPDSARVTVDH